MLRRRPYHLLLKKLAEGFRPYYDSTVWTKLKAQGAVMLGKTNMDEFAMGSTSETSVYGAPLNPRNTNHVTGGSSGGVAAAVCANIAAYGFRLCPHLPRIQRIGRIGQVIADLLHLQFALTQSGV